jgi:hypothetical protein
MSNSATPERCILPCDAWPQKKREEDARSAIYLAIVTDNELSNINQAKFLETFGVKWPAKKFERVWSEEAERFRKERLTKLPPNTDIPAEGK